MNFKAVEEISQTGEPVQTAAQAPDPGLSVQGKSRHVLECPKGSCRRSCHSKSSLPSPSPSSPGPWEGRSCGRLQSVTARLGASPRIEEKNQWLGNLAK